MFKNKILKKIGAGIMAGLCAFTLIGTNIGGLKTSAATTAKEPLLSGDEVIKQAAKYLGVPYGWDCKGYDGVYSSSSPKKQSMETVRKKGLDCSGLIYATLTDLGVRTSGFPSNNPVPQNYWEYGDGSFAKYGVYSDKACKTKVGEIKIGEKGTGSIKLSSGTYYVKEISAPKGYALSTKVYELKANQTVTVYEDFQTGKIKINKTTEDKQVRNIEFKVTGSDGSSYTKKTNALGIAEFPDLKVYDMKTGKAITYTVTEINVAARYKTPKAQNVTLTKGNVDLTVNVNFDNDLKKGSIKINKRSEDNQNGDREFTITGNGKTYNIKTGADGVAILKDIPVYDSNNKKITYTIAEKNVPVKYVVPADHKVTLTADATTNVTFKNVLKKFTAEVVKKDSEMGVSQGDATLAGAVYGLYLDGDLVDTYTTDENGYFKTKEYVCGNYTIQEISPSEGYLLNKTVYSVGTQPENYTLEHNPISKTVTEDVVKGKISIIKHSDDDETEVVNLEKGAEFEVYLKSAGSYANAKDSEKDYLITDENGFAATKLMPYGVYTVHQTKTVNDAAFVSDFDVFIAENEKTYEYILNNAPFKSYIHITKLDAETGKNIAYEGAGFQIYDAENNLVNMGVDTFYTNSEGYLITPEMLHYGDYTLVEVQAPMGYALDSEPVAFSVTAANSEIENAVNIVKVQKSDIAQKGKISVQKTGDIFSSVTALGSAIYEDENGETHESGQTTYTPVFEENGLSGAVYQVIASEDIVTADGTVRAPQAMLFPSLPPMKTALLKQIYCTSESTKLRKFKLLTATF